MSTPTDPTPTPAEQPAVLPAPAHPMPESLILVKGDPAQGTGREVFGIWPSGYSRQITAAEYTLWGSPAPHYTIAFGSDDEWNQLAAYDRALRA